MARTRSQQVKVSEYDRADIVALAELDGVTPSTWCYNAIMSVVEAQRDRLKGRLRLVPPNPEAENQGSDDLGPSRLEA